MIEKLLKDALEMVRNGSHLDLAAQKIEQAMGLLPKPASIEETGMEEVGPALGHEIDYDTDPFKPNPQEKREKRRGK